MSVWRIEPRDPLIFRDGKPFNPTPGARAKSLPFPNPSTIAGAVRTRAGQDEKGQFTGNPEELKKIGIRGPVLTNLQNPEICYFPAPADCLIIGVDGDEKQAKRLWARPVTLVEGETSNLPETLQPVSVCPVEKSKPLTGAPRFWTWTMLEQWLNSPVNDRNPVVLKNLGLAGLTSESRMHVKIDSNAQTAAEGMLFQTSGLEFAVLGEEEKKSKDLQKLEEFALLVETETNLRPGVDFLGGERRMVNWKEGGKLPQCPGEIKDKIKADGSCRLLLATPALFDNDFLPKWIKTRTPGVTVEIIAAALPRGTAVSGWDFEKKQQKASRRLAPAGSVYFLKLEGTAEAIGKFVDAVWLHNISDDEQDRRDGFGLALLGTWNWQDVPPLEVKNENS